MEMKKVPAYKVKEKEVRESLSGIVRRALNQTKASRQLGGIAHSKTLQCSLPAEEMSNAGDRENGKSA